MVLQAVATNWCPSTSLYKGMSLETTLEKRKWKKPAFSLLNKLEMESKIIKYTKRLARDDHRGRIKKIIQWKRRKKFGTLDRKQQGVQRCSPTDVNSCGAEGRRVQQQQQIKHKENVFLCVYESIEGGAERWKEKLLPECRRWKHQQRGGF